MKLGLGSYAYAWAIGVPGLEPPSPMTAFGLLERAASLGVHLIQIADNLPLGRLSAGELRALRAQADDLHIAIEVGTRGIAREHLKRYLELAVFFSSPLLRVVVDTADHHPSEDEVVSTLKPFMKDFEQVGVVLAIENHDRFRAAALAGIIERLDSAFIGICLDTINSLGSLEGPTEVVATLAPWVVNLHVKDVTIRRSNHSMGFIVEGCPAGEGQIDIPWLLAEMRSKARDPNAILELWPSPEEDLAATIAKEDAWVVSSLHYLRQLLPQNARGRRDLPA